MGLSDLDSGCKRHPTHKQVPGVCPACLRERLSKLDSSANNSYKTAKTTISNASSSCISTSTSTPTYSTASSSSTRVFLQQAAASTALSKNRAITKNNNTNIHPKGQQNHRRTGSDTGVPLGLVLKYGNSKGVRSTSTHKEDGSIKGTKGSSTNTAGSAASGLKKSRSVACAPRIYRGGSRHGKRGGGGDSESTRLRDESRSRSRSSQGGGSGGHGVVDSEVEDDHKGSSGNTSSRGKKGGFWKKLIHSTSKKSKGVLTHSKSTLKDRSGHHQQL